MNILLIHPNFPAQFRYLAQALAAAGEHKVVFLTNSRSNSIKGVQKIIYNPADNPENKETFAKAQAQGMGVYYRLSRLVNDGFQPDLVYTHCGFGASMFVRQVLPDVPIAGYAEWFFDPQVNLFAEQTSSQPLKYMQQAQQRNAVSLLELSATDIIICPTQFQKIQFPESIQAKTVSVYDGVDTQRFKPAGNHKRMRKELLAKLELQIPEEAPIVTYVSRGMEPLRGFPTFAQALIKAQSARSSFHTLIIGSEKPHYGSPPEHYSTYVEKYCSNSALDNRRTHLTGLIDTELYAAILQISDLHIYLTRPFVLSWSLPEAMSTGCRIIASNTAPVKEFVKNNEEAHLVDFKNVNKLAKTTIQLLDKLGSQDDIAMRKKARKKIVKKYSLKKLLPKQLKILYTTAASG